MADEFKLEIVVSPSSFDNICDLSGVPTVPQPAWTFSISVCSGVIQDGRQNDDTEIVSLGDIHHNVLVDHDTGKVGLTSR